MYYLQIQFKVETSPNQVHHAKYSKKLRIKWNFKLTVFELTVPDLYLFSNAEGAKKLINTKKFLISGLL